MHAHIFCLLDYRTLSICCLLLSTHCMFYLIVSLSELYQHVLNMSIPLLTDISGNASCIQHNRVDETQKHINVVSRRHLYHVTAANQFQEEHTLLSMSRHHPRRLQSRGVNSEEFSQFPGGSVNDISTSQQLGRFEITCGYREY